MNGTAGFDERILVGLDGSPNATEALAWALEEAAARHAQVEAIYVWHEPTMASSAVGYLPLTGSELDELGQKILAEALSAITADHGVDVHLGTVSGHPSEVLASAAEDVDVSLVVAGARGHGGLAELFLGSVSHALTHRCPKPLVIVPPEWASTRSHHNDKSIVVGVDGSTESEHGAAWAIREGAARHVQVEAVMVWASPAPVLPAQASLGDLAATGAADHLEDILREAIERNAMPGVQVERKVLSGHPAKRLTKEAASGQMLVVGSRGLGRAREAVLRSVSHACTNHSTVPVIVIPKKSE